MSGLKNIKRYKIKVITPIHIGNGNILIRGVDFLEKNGKTYFINRDEIYKFIPLEDLKRISTIEYLKETLNKVFKKVDIEKFSLFVSETSPKNEVRDCIKDPFGNPYIPGSSLKGAIRTTLIKNLVSKDREANRIFRHLLDKISETKGKYKKRRFKSGAFIENRYFNISQRQVPKKRSRSYYDVGRTLIIRDIMFKKRDLELFKVKVFGKKGNIEDLVISVISLKPEAKSIAEIVIDHFLLARLFNEYRPVIINLDDEIRKFSIDWIKKEVKKLKSLKSKAKNSKHAFEDVLSFYDEISGRLIKGEIFVHLGFGIGWRGITGDILEVADNEIRKKILSELRLGKGGDFPSSRRFVELQDGTFAPMGWLKLEPIDYDG